MRTWLDVLIVAVLLGAPVASVYLSAPGEITNQVVVPICMVAMVVLWATRWR